MGVAILDICDANGLNSRTALLSPIRKQKGPGMNRAFRVSLFLLLALRMSLLAVLVGGLRVLFGTARVLLALGVVALAVMFGGGAMGLGGIFVVFGSLVVFISGHGNPRWLSTPSRHKLAACPNVPAT